MNGDTIGNTILHYNTIIHRDLYEIERVKRWNDTITYMHVLILFYIAMSRRGNGTSGADDIGNLAPSGCCVCVIVYHYHSAGYHCLPHEEKCEVNDKFQRHYPQRSTNR